MRIAFLFLVCLCACASAPPGPKGPLAPPIPVALAAPSLPPIASSTSPPPVDPLEEAERRFREAGVEGEFKVPEKSGQLLANGLDEARVAMIIEQLLARYHDDTIDRLLARRQENTPAMTPDEAWNARAGAVVDLLFKHLGEIGTRASFELLVRWIGTASTSAYEAKDALRRILTRQAFATVGACSPPVPSDVLAERQDLLDFAVLEPSYDRSQAAHTHTRWTARAATALELDELAYFMAATKQERAANGAAVPPLLEGRPATDVCSNDCDEKMNSAWVRGDIAAHASLGRAYLRSLGYPGPLQAIPMRHWPQRPGVVSVLMDVALSDEMLGNLDEAAILYRRADAEYGAWMATYKSLFGPPSLLAPPFGAARRRFVPAMEGLLRATAPSSGCGPALLERMYAIEVCGRMYAIEACGTYGPDWLVNAGFDLARLYRGGGLTLGRDLPRPVLEGALRQAPAPLGLQAVARLHQRGAEDYGWRARALDGMADTGGKAGLQRVIGFAKQWDVATEVHALALIGSMAADVYPDPCRSPGPFDGLRHGSFNSRAIRRLNESCDTRLSDAEQDALALTIAPLASSVEPLVREAVAGALRHIASGKALPWLHVLAKDHFHPKDAQLCKGASSDCHDYYPVREAAREAIKAIEERRYREAQATSPRGKP